MHKCDVWLIYSHLFAYFVEQLFFHVLRLQLYIHNDKFRESKLIKFRIINSDYYIIWLLSHYIFTNTVIFEIKYNKNR